MCLCLALFLDSCMIVAFLPVSVFGFCEFDISPLTSSYSSCAHTRSHCFWPSSVSWILFLFCLFWIHVLEILLFGDFELFSLPGLWVSFLYSALCLLTSVNVLWISSLVISVLNTFWDPKLWTVFFLLMIFGYMFVKNKNIKTILCTTSAYCVTALGSLTYTSCPTGRDA